MSVNHDLELTKYSNGYGLLEELLFTSVEHGFVAVVESQEFSQERREDLPAVCHSSALVDQPDHISGRGRLCSSIPNNNC
jgi:hypothetical protein